MARPSLSDEDRESRRNHLLAVARELFRAAGTLPSVTEIAEAAGIAKGSVYLSFSTKEEMFVALLEESFADLLQRVVACIAVLPTAGNDAAAEFSRSFSESFQRYPDLLPLASMTNAVLEKNLPEQAILNFKLGLAAGLTSAGRLLENGTPHLAPGRGVELLLYTWSMTLGLWQALDYPPLLRTHLQRVELKVLNRDFSTELRHAVQILWQGAFTHWAR